MTKNLDRERMHDDLVEVPEKLERLSIFLLHFKASPRSTINAVISMMLITLPAHAKASLNLFSFPSAKRLSTVFDN